MIKKIHSHYYDKCGKLLLSAASCSDWKQRQELEHQLYKAQKVRDWVFHTLTFCNRIKRTLGALDPILNPITVYKNFILRRSIRRNRINELNRLLNTLSSTYGAFEPDIVMLNVRDLVLAHRQSTRPIFSYEMDDEKRKRGWG